MIRARFTRPFLARLLVVFSAALLAVSALAAPAPAAPASVTGPTGEQVTVSTTTVSPGDAFQLDYFFGNTSDSAQSVLVSGSFAPADAVTFITGTGTSNTTLVSGNPPVVQLSPAARSKAEATVRFRVSPDFTGSQIVLTLSEGSPAVPFGTLTLTTPQADVSTSTTLTGSLLTGTLGVDTAATGNGPAAATGVTLTTRLPAQTTSVTGLPAGCSYAPGTQQVTCTTATLPNGTTTHFAYTANLSALTVGLPLTITTTRTASAPSDPVASNDTSTDTCTVVTGLIVLC
ncbi:hypothetical protein ACFV6F_32120 [Kitasatospora phosalacinea]|uniref:hypothetical protein n=1 Tax=Kitasatospora phosalacinea TaxID=2065 RepID=UPI0036523143